MITFWIKKLSPKAINSHLDGIRGFYKAQACETEWRSISSSLQGVRIAALSSNRDVSLPRLDVHHNYGYRDRRSERNQDVSWNYTRPPYTLPGYSPHRFTDPLLFQKEGGPADSGPQKWGRRGTYCSSSISRLAHSSANPGIGDSLPGIVAQIGLRFSSTCRFEAELR